jgi:peptide/nickel transport system permease protein
LEVLSEEFILAARARGIKEKTIIYSHALKNALIPIITIYGMSLPFLLGGSVLIESVFSWPGMGSLAIEAVQNRDYPLILATTMMGAFLVVLGNLLADIMYAVVDPRVSYDT